MEPKHTNWLATEPKVALLSQTRALSTALIENELQDIYGAQRALHKKLEQLNYNEEEVNGR